MYCFVKSRLFRPIYDPMLEAFLLVYGVAVVFGSWLMLKGVSDAPMGYEDSEGFHFGYEE